jgi:hypothetical protein
MSKFREYFIKKPLLRSQPTKYFNYFSLEDFDYTSTLCWFFINNRSLKTVKLTSIILSDWPGANDALFTAKLDNNIIWGGFSDNPPTYIYEDDFINSESWRNVSSGSHEIEFGWGTSAEGTGYDITLEFENKQTLRIVV